ncbi:hypothetical protein A3Q56_02663 [Intoshia linei]|uniref:Uncharacterized protein n=1 Tax=Intoshia linei TaxID=1819745 RepID=A0A177B5J8_9BILA|nr:hypothetical protein A3Q56_02663 [Intoshia linei]
MNQRRLTNVQEIMYFHPSYSCQFINLETFLMSDCGPLLKTYRHYIAIIAAARHKCKYLVELYTLNFLKCGGDQKWLTSIKNTPLKLQNIQEVNKILAHKPWMINKCHIYNLRHAQKGDSWSTSEMLQALIIMVHFHSLSSFVYGTGVAFESDTPSSHSFYIHDKFSVEGFENLPDNAADGNESKTKRENLQSKNLFKLNNLIDDLTYKYTDFKKCGEPADMHTLRFQDFSWNKEGYSLCSLYPNSGRLLDSKFNAIKDLTYTQISNVNNNDFYTAIMRYLQSIYGLRYDDYNYSEINILLNRELKSTIKIVGCLPEEMTKEMYNKFMYGFEDAEKVLVNIIIMEARVECSLLYALKAVNKYISSN